MLQRLIEARAGDHRVSLEDRADPGRVDVLGTLWPPHDDILCARSPHAFEVSDDAVRHSFAGGDEFALAASVGRELANESLRDSAADADREDPVSGLFRFINHGYPL